MALWKRRKALVLWNVTVAVTVAVTTLITAITITTMTITVTHTVVTDSLLVQQGSGTAC